MTDECSRKLHIRSWMWVCMVCSVDWRAWSKAHAGQEMAVMRECGMVGRMGAVEPGGLLWFSCFGVWFYNLDG